MIIERIITKFEQIKENIDLIKANLPEDANDFEKLGLIKDGIYKRYEYSVELVLDISAMLNSYFKLGIPENTKQLIENLRKNRIISDQICNIILEMRAFRNGLVHIYDKLSDSLAYTNIKESINQFNIIEDNIIQYLKETKQN